jgi:hypothetical protein
MHDLLDFLLLRGHKQGLRLKTCSFKAAGALVLPDFSWVFPPPPAPQNGTEKLLWVSGFRPYFPSDLTTSSDIILYLLLGCSLLTYYECQDFSGGRIL